MTARSRMHRAALAYVRLGVRVIPLGDGGTERAKLPRIGEWQNAGTLQTETIDSWWNTWPGANVGGLTGHGRAVVDVDPKAGGLVSLEALEEAHGPLPLTPTVKTGSGGLHYWFALADGVELGNSAGKLGPGLDIRGDGGQVVLPPSIHPNGAPYSWLGEARIGEVPFAPMPPWMLNELLGPTTTTGTAKPTMSRTEWAEFTGTRRGPASRTPALEKLCGHLLAHGLDPEEVGHLALAWNARYCVPPHEAAHVLGTVAGILHTRIMSWKVGTP